VVVDLIGWKTFRKGKGFTNIHKEKSCANQEGGKQGKLKEQENAKKKT